MSKMRGGSRDLINLNIELTRPTNTKPIADEALKGYWKYIT